jgi:hypothetical protein
MSWKRFSVRVMKRISRAAPLGLRLTPPVKIALQTVATDDQRSLASYVERLLIGHPNALRIGAPMSYTIYGDKGSGAFSAEAVCRGRRALPIPLRLSER